MSSSIDIGPADIARVAQGVARKGLSLGIAKFLHEQWGEGWMDRLNDSIERFNQDQRVKQPGWRDRPPVRWGKHEPQWDNNAMLWALRDCVRVSSNLGGRRQQIMSLAEGLRTGRNKLSHEGELDPADKDFAKKYINRTIALMQVIDANEGIESLKRLRALLDSPDGARISAGNVQPEAEKSDEYRLLMAEIQQIKSHLTSNSSAAAMDQKQPEVSAEAATAESYDLAQTSVVRGRRKGPIPDPKPGLVLFPNVSLISDADSDLGYIHATAYHSQASSALGFMVGFKDPGRSNLHYQMIIDGRINEADGSKASLQTHSRINPTDFGGSSFGLAAVIADKAARYGMAAIPGGGHVIATGLIVPDGHGAIGAIDGFEAKVRLLDRDARRGSLFIFPHANLQQTDQATKERLVRADREGRYAWRAIEHLNDLTWLFESKPAEARLSPAAAGSQIPNSPTDSTPEQSLAAERVRPELPIRKKPTAYLTAGGLAVGAGLALLAGAYVVGSLRSHAAIDPAVVQASDERLNHLSRAAALVKVPLVSAPGCRELLAATTSILEIDRQRFLAVHKAAIDTSEQCSVALKDSDSRWATLEAIAGSIARSERLDLSRVSAARSALTEFDLSQVADAERKSVLVSIDDVLASRLAAEKRWNLLADALGNWQKSETSASLDSVVTALRALTASDLSDVDNAKQGLLVAARNAEATMHKSDERLARLMAAYQRAKETGDFASAEELERTQQAITPLDIVRAAPAQSDAMNDGKRLLAQMRLVALEREAANFEANPNRITATKLQQVAAALTPDDKPQMSASQVAASRTAQSAAVELLNSNARHKALLKAFMEVGAAETAGRGVATAYRALLAAADDLRDFDQASSQPDLRSAVARANLVREKMEASDERLADALKWAEAAASFGKDGPADVYRALQKSRSALVPLDFERATTEQLALLDSVCGITAPLPPGTLAPKETCVPIDLKIKPVTLKPKQPIQ